MRDLKFLKNIPDSDWNELFGPDWNVNGVLRQLGMDTNQARWRQHVISKSIQLNRPRSNKRTSRYTVDQVQSAISRAICWSDALKHLNLPAHGNNHLTLKKLVSEYGISIDHFDLKASYKRGKGTELTPESILISGSATHRSTLRRIVLKYNILEYKCSKCGNDGSWLNDTLNLQLDHIDGDSTNNVIANLRFLCPNCHSQTSTYGRKKR